MTHFQWILLVCASVCGLEDLKVAGIRVLCLQTLKVLWPFTPLYLLCAAQSVYVWDVFEGIPF